TSTYGRKRALAPVFGSCCPVSRGNRWGSRRSPCPRPTLSKNWRRVVDSRLFDSVVRRASALLGLALAVSLSLTACVGIPSSGPVEAGPEFSETAETDTIFNPLGPQPGAEPLAILEGFIDAFTGTQGD